ncbi:MAG: OB-fold nucleic acid binding domain-containing protein [Candidatus Nanoarchaeia archaeon]|nr:OB-fold nucleic acid binding domain-containing protein [Candidatus Nanoarchaeia archaeon]MDD5499771.1 OB-fold nucleic acid binding domain-containing protein [Candidatus Nanoarchaeia archaeon]
MSEFERLTAYKSDLKTLNEAPYTSVQGESDYLSLKNLKISRVRVFGTVVSKTIAQDLTYAFLTIDDSTDTMSISSRKDFNTGKTNIELFEKIMPGDNVEVIGRINEWEGKRKISAEMIKKIIDPNHWLYHKYELALSKEKIERIKEKKEQGISTGVEIKKDENPNDAILKIIKENDVGKGTSLALINNLSRLSKKQVEESLKNLLNDSAIYEPTKHNYKVLDE